MKFHLRLILTSISLCLALSGSGHALEKPFDHSVWDQFLKKFVSPAGEVNYSGLIADSELLDQYLEQLKNVHYDALMSSWPREERIALWMNAFHAAVIDTVRQHYPLKKGIQDIPGVWEMGAIDIGGKVFSLNEIRTDILLKHFRDEKIHTSLYCGAKSCPRLLNEAFVGPRIEGQLFVATKTFVNDLSKNTIKPGEKKIKVSKLFKWYGSDFKLDFGSFGNERGLKDDQYAVLSFLAHYHDDADVIQYLEDGNYKFSYQKFDWKLNEWAQPAK